MDLKKILGNIAALVFVFGWGVGGTLLWWFTDNPEWLYGWVMTVIILLAG